MGTRHLYWILTGPSFVVWVEMFNRRDCSFYFRYSEYVLEGEAKVSHALKFPKIISIRLCICLRTDTFLQSTKTSYPLK